MDWSDGMFDAEGINAFDKYFELNWENQSNLIEIIDAFERGATTYPKRIARSDLDAPIYPESNAEASFRVYTPLMANYTIFKVGFSIVPLHKLVYLLGLQSFQRPEKMKGMNWWKMVRTMFDENNFPLGSNLWPWLNADIVIFADFRPLVPMKNFVHTIKLKTEFQKKIDMMAKMMELDHAVGVHVRYTDKKPSEKLSLLMNNIEKHLGKGVDKVFLCTDNKDVEIDFKKRFGNSVRMTEKYIPTVEGEGIHIWASKQKDESLKRKMFEDSVKDMWLLSRCRFLYWQGNSSFSLISKILMNDGDRCVDWLSR